MIEHTDELVRRLYLARLEKKIARGIMVAAAEAHGMCTANPFPSTAACHDVRLDLDPEDGPLILNEENWCEACRARKPSWEVWREKSKAAGGALRSVLSAGKRLAKP